MPPRMPPMSSQCAMQQENATSLPLWKIGIVGDVDVARPDVAGAEMLDLGLDRLRHAADEHRQPDADRDGLASRREQTGGEVERLVDDDVVSGAHEVGLHFLGHRDDAVAHDLRDHGIDLACAARRALGTRLARDGLCPFCHGAYRPPAATLIIRCPQASTSSLSPGSNTVVAACSSISAGPLMRLPAVSAARA